MTRGTTPTIKITTNADLTEAVAVYVTFSQARQVVVEKDLQDLTITEDGIELELTQADTLKFYPGIFTVEIQVRAKFADGTAVASNIARCSVGAILKDGQI